MNKKAYIFLISLFFTITTSFSQQLVINEVSQGPSGTKEYVELIVVGSPSCNAIPTMDLRGYYIDDNNGTFATGGGTGIAPGCVRFANIPLWSAIPYGTIIVIYNDGDVNATMPPNDLSMTDGNCLLVIPISNTTLLESNNTQPAIGTSVYPTVGFVAGGNWTQIGMANGDDSFQTRDAFGNLIHSVSWGNNTSSNIIYFAGSAAGKVMSMTNSTNNNPFTQSNWVNQNVAGNETPGVANNAANLAWINSMNNSCVALQPFGATTASTNPGCACNGLASITPTGAVAPYTYTWAPSGGNASNASALCAGIYTVISTSSNNCTLSATYTLTNAVALTTTPLVNNPQCFGATGSATINASGVAGPYTYTWTPAVSTSSTASGLSAGNYTVNVGAGACTSTSTITIAAPPAAIVITPSVTNPACFGGTGSASVTASGGVGGYTYAWSPSTSTSFSATGLGAGNQTITVTSGACSNSAVITVTVPPAIGITTAVTPPACFGGTGSASVTASGGVGGYTYSWSPSTSTSFSATGLGAGNQTITVTSGACSNSAVITVTAPPAIGITPAVTPPACFGGTGSASVTASGGTGVYTYAWSPSTSTSFTATGIGAGTQTITVTSGACSNSAVITVTAPPAIGITPAVTPPTCFGGTGSASVTASGGTGVYTYAWSPSTSTLSTATGLGAGNQTITVTSGACSNSAVITVTVPTAIGITTAVTNPACFGGTGSAIVTASGGVGGYTYSWSPSTSTSFSATGLGAGNQTITVTSVVCSNSAVITVTVPVAIGVATAVNNPACFGGTGSATITASGGTGGYIYTWLPSGGNFSISPSLSAGNYTAVINDANNCTLSVSMIISQPNPLLVNVSGITACKGQNGTLNGTVNGGQAPYTYFWNGVSGSNTLVVNPTYSTIYLLNVIDNNGCNSNIDTALVYVAPSLSLSVSPSKTICATKSANLSAFASGGLGNYQFNWMPINVNSQAIAVSPQSTTIYSITVSDNCSIPITLTTAITVESLISSTLIADNYAGCVPLCINFTNTAFTSTQNIVSSTWNFGDGTNSSLFNSSHCFFKEGNYTITNSFITLNGCVNTQTLINAITISTKPTADFYVSNPQFTFFKPEVTFQNFSTNATSYFWDFSGLDTSSLTEPIFSFVEPANYLITLIAKNKNCSDTALKTIECLPEFTFYCPNAFTPNDDDLNEIFLPKGDGWVKESFVLTIFDRWGEQIFLTKQYDLGWNGKKNGIGNVVKNDLYVWRISLKDIFGKQHEFFGHIEVLK